MNQKINTANGILRRVFGLSDYFFCDENINVAYGFLSKNSYPKQVIHKLIENMTNKIRIQRTVGSSHQNETPNQTNNYVFLLMLLITYVSYLSISVKN